MTQPPVQYVARIDDGLCVNTKLLVGYHEQLREALKTRFDDVYAKIGESVAGG